MVKGESTPFEIAVEHEPKVFWLDRRAKVFGLFFDESRHPKRVLIYRAYKASAEGKADEAATLYDRALKTEEPPPDTGRPSTTTTSSGPAGDERADRARPRPSLPGSGEGRQADAALGRVDRLLRDSEEYRLLQSRLEVRRGDYDKAFQRLRKGLKSNELDSSEGYALLAVAARATGHKEELDKALKKARENGADVDALAAGTWSRGVRRARPRHP